MKRCVMCGNERDVTMFHSKSAKCKLCKAAVDRQRPGREGSTERRMTDASRARQRRYAALNRYPDHASARRAVRNALQCGELSRPDACEECGSGRTRRDGVPAIQAHHDDYAKPLAVRWLCPACHTKWHKEHDAARTQGDAA